MGQPEWTDSYLDSMRLKGDDVADKAVASLYDGGALNSREAFQRVNDLIDHINFENEEDQSAWPEPAREFARVSRQLPDWYDEELVKKGQELFYVNGFGATALLLCASLPECYVMSRGIHVLGRTTYLKNRPKLRIVETARMVGAVMKQGGLNPDGEGISAAAKVRLLHAAVRHLILHHHSSPGDEGMGKVFAETEWDPAWGHPICQEDQAFTLQTFAYVVLRGWDALGVNSTDEQKDAFVHCWNVVGHIMGIDRGLLPEPEPGDTSYNRFEQAKLLFETIKERQKGHTEDGENITRSLVTMMMEMIEEHVEHTILIKRIGGRKLKYLPNFLMEYLIGRETVELLGVKSPATSRLDRLLLRICLFIVKRGEKKYQGITKLGPVRNVAAAMHVIITESLSKLPKGHTQQFLPMQVNRSEESA